MNRKCIAARSVRFHFIPCNEPTVDGDFCIRHSKYAGITYTTIQSPSTPQGNTLKLLKKYAAAWKLRLGLLRWRRLGPAAGCPCLALNDTEIYSLESVNAIRPVYRFSIVDAEQNIWIFDIRSLKKLWDDTTGPAIINPYTRAPFSSTDMKRFHVRIAWLQRRHYNLHYPLTIVNQSIRQAYRQRVVDTFSIMDRHGYVTPVEWFEDLTYEKQKSLRKELYGLWMFRLNLTGTTQRVILPRSQGNIFEFSAGTCELIEVQNLDIFWRLVTEAEKEEDRTTGVIYCLMALSYVCEACYETYGWLREQIPVVMPTGDQVLIRIANGITPEVRTYAVNAAALNQYMVQHGPQMSFDGPGALQLFEILPPDAVQFLFNGRPMPAALITQRDARQET